ncbi:hypothetical protein ACPW96_07735 [Micromonospora sp. DT81.3]|uniref:hypothetical protein n=1 Tax=Micromonospora sp. DT81.3 TaxID=3416523 RepID=UPI003CF615BA
MGAGRRLATELVVISASAIHEMKTTLGGRARDGVEEGLDAEPPALMTVPIHGVRRDAV